VAFEPKSLSDVLQGLAGRIKRMDISQGARLREIWSAAADPVVAAQCRVEFIKDGVLHVSAPSGALAERVRAQETTLLEAFAVLGATAPHSLKTSVQR
jgi:predicted nucleic acid-binding Zn ribbon protein